MQRKTKQKTRGKNFQIWSFAFLNPLNCCTSYFSCVGWPMALRFVSLWHCSFLHGNTNKANKLLLLTRCTIVTACCMHLLVMSVGEHKWFIGLLEIYLFFLSFHRSILYILTERMLSCFLGQMSKQIQNTEKNCNRVRKYKKELHIFVLNKV